MARSPAFVVGPVEAKFTGKPGLAGESALAPRRRAGR
jgi:hypothetical protein